MALACHGAFLYSSAERVCKADAERATLVARENGCQWDKKKLLPKAI